MVVSDLLDKLLARFPASDAEPWDHVGLSVGDLSAKVDRVAVALDAMPPQIDEAHRRGASILVTHHPVYIKAPDSFVPEVSQGPAASVSVYRAAQLGVSIISLHTNLDRSLDAREALPALPGLKAISSLEHPADPELLGLGAICACDATSLEGLATSAARAFGTDPRVWGDPRLRIRRVAILGGSLGGLGELVIKANADAVICGEAGYHVAQDLALRGCGVILLGHDRSEEPFKRILAESVAACGVSPQNIVTIHGSRQWRTIGEETAKGACA